jgi:hypothetical protein
MSELGTGHVREMPLKSGLEVGYVWLTQENTERLDMSGQSLWNLARGRICLA